MPKRQNRLRPLEHEWTQIENLKTLEPIATPPENMPLSDALLDIAIEALQEAHRLEDGKSPQLKRLDRLIRLVENLSTLALGDNVL